MRGDRQDNHELTSQKVAIDVVVGNSSVLVSDGVGFLVEQDRVRPRILEIPQLW